MPDADPSQDAPDEKQAAPAGPAPETPLAVRASCFTFVFLVLVAVSTWLYLYFNSTETFSIFSAGGWLRFGFILVLIVVIPIVVFRTITLWMMRGKSEYPDIQYAWQAGIDALRKNGMSLYSAPICIVLGGLGPNARRNFIHASGYQLRVDSVPEGPSPFHWYASPDLIMIALNDVSWLHAACTPTRRPQSAPAGQTGPQAAPSISRTISPSDLQFGGEQEPAPENKPESTPEPAPVPQELANLRGTIVPPSFSGPSPTQAARPAPMSTRVDSETSTTLLRRLQHVCRLLRNARHPVCPINGILTLLPYELLQNDQQDMKELERAVAADLSVAQRELRLRCPVTVVVTGMEKERGFRELIRRVGPQRASRQRFGQRFDVRAEATESELSKFAGHVCGTFEDWVYTMFGEKDALSRPGNNLLFAMLCRVRRSVRTRLANVLAGFGTRPDDGFSLIFSGCYFAGTGPKGERQAFARGVLDKFLDEQGEVEWTDEALQSDIKHDRLTKIGWGVATLLVSCLIGLFIYSKMS